MPAPPTTFPTLSMKPDGETLRIQLENPAIESEMMDGGYYITRPRYTRTPPRTFLFQFTDISEADKNTLMAFWDGVKGSSYAFNWVNPTTGVTHNVRFSKGLTLEFIRVGIGTNHRYNTSEISLTEV